MDEITFANPAARRLGKRLLRQRTKVRGLTQDQLAELSGVSQGTISRIERGEMFPSLATLHKLRDALGLPPDEFAEWIEAAA